MKFALHGMCSLHHNILSDIRLAKMTGYSGIELHTEKLWRFIESGRSPLEVKEALINHQIEATAIDIIGHIEVTEKMAREKLFNEARVLCEFAKVINAPTIQLNAFEGLSGLSLASQLTLIAKNIQVIADIGKEYGIRFQYEGAAWTSIAHLDHYLQLHEKVNRDNFGFVLDTWHLWASRGTTPDQLARLPGELIYNVHLSDGKRPNINETWPDEKTLRGYIIGQGDIPLNEWVEAILSTGYVGFYSGEFLNESLWESDYFELSVAMLDGMKKLFK